MSIGNHEEVVVPHIDMGGIELFGTTAALITAGPLLRKSCQTPEEAATAEIVTPETVLGATAVQELAITADTQD